VASATTLDSRVPVPTAGPASRPPAAALAAAGLALLDAVAVVAVAFTGLDGLLTSPGRPSGAVAVLVLLALAAWAVLGAGGGLVLTDGSGARLLTLVACAEVALLTAVFLLGLTTTSLDALAPGLPVPALALSAVAVPVGKLLLASAPSTLAWLDAGPRPRACRPELSGPQRSARTATVVLIGLALLSVALVNPAGPAPDGAAPAATTGR
jgi:hypothetical protein